MKNDNEKPENCDLTLTENYALDCSIARHQLKNKTQTENEGKLTVNVIDAYIQILTKRIQMRQTLTLTSIVIHLASHVGRYICAETMQNKRMNCRQFDIITVCHAK